MKNSDLSKLGHVIELFKVKIRDFQLATKPEVNIGQQKWAYHWVGIVKGNNFCSGQKVTKGHGHEIWAFKDLTIIEKFQPEIKEKQNRNSKIPSHTFLRKRLMF